MSGCTGAHDLGEPRPGVVQMCRADDCTALRIGTRRGRWRELTFDEQSAVTAHMMQAIAIADAMVIIHGPERGMRRAREVLGYPDV